MKLHFIESGYAPCACVVYSENQASAWVKPKLALLPSAEHCFFSLISRTNFWNHVYFEGSKNRDSAVSKLTDNASDAFTRMFFSFHNRPFVHYVKALG